MRTDDLIAQLSDRLEPVGRNFHVRALGKAVCLGIIGSTVLMLSLLGLRHDLVDALRSFGMWTKLIYTFTIAAFGFWLVERSGRPGAHVARAAQMLALPVGAIAILAIVQLRASGADSHALIMGHTSRVCAFLVSLTALPTLLTTFWALRRMAPTHLAQAGMGAGIFAGAAGAFVYSFHCPESSIPFVGIWYSLGILLTAVIGGFLGRNLLRW